MMLLKERGVDFDAINYYIEPVSESTLRELLAKLHMKPIELFRTKEPLFAELEISTRPRTVDELIAILAHYPDLLQRPIVVRGDKAVIARPAEKVRELF